MTQNSKQGRRKEERWEQESWRPQSFPRGRRLDGYLAGKISGAGTILVPSVRVDERDDRLLVIAEIPGVEIEELTVTVLADAVRIVGERPAGQSPTRNGLRPGTHCLSRFTREIRITRRVDAGGVDAQFVNGTLTVRLPVLGPPAPEGTARRRRGAKESRGTLIQIH